ncbi:MAG: HAD family hydrolase [Terracidiphilus sp.]
MSTATESSTARVFIQPGFAWDGQEAYLFDIDGTLMRNRDRIHADAFASGVRRVLDHEISLAGVAVHGSTDTAILHEACLRAGIPAGSLAEKERAILKAISEEVAARRAEMIPVLMPGVEAVLGHLAARGALLGLATGNLESVGWLKMEVAGLRQWFRFGGFSDRFPIRSELIGHAAEVARQMAGPEARVCVVGDTPRDIAAAHANGLPVVAIATGNFSFEELLAHQPEVCASSLADLLAATPNGTGGGPS